MKLTIELRGRDESAQHCHIRASSKGGMIRIKTGVQLPSSLLQNGNIMAVLPEHKIKADIVRAKLAETQKYIDLHLYEHNTEPTLDKLHKRFNKADSKPVDINTAFKEFLNTKKRFTVERFNDYRRMFAYFKGYNSTISIETLDIRAANAFGEYLEGQSLSENSIGQQLSMLKAFMGYLIDNGMTTLRRVDLSKIDDYSRDCDIIYHPQHEITKLFQAKINTEAQHHARNLYLLQCLIGTRHSDTDSSRWVIEGEFMRVVPKKTETTTAVEVKLHLRPEALQILNEYNNLQFPKFSNSDYNTLIREVGSLAGIDMRVKLLKGRKGYKAGEAVIKHQLMSSHVARATFICLMLNNGISESIICKMAGISQATLKHYAHIMDETVKAASESVYAKTGDLSMPMLRKVV